jgi:xanthine/CO dehydrogenase XdhC/CoxF family maturation factor
VNKDLRDIVASARGGTLATVVRVRGSSYRKPGARMHIDDVGGVIGSVSGGCLEREIVRRGAWWASQGPVVRVFTSDPDPGDEDRSATGCGGTVEVLVETADAPLAALRWIAARRQPACLATRLSGAIGARFAITRDATFGDVFARDVAERVLATRRHAWVDDIFYEYVPAPRELLIAGRHHDVAPLVRLARAVGWEVTVAATGVARAALSEPDHQIALDARYVADWAAARPDAAVVIMTHSIALDRELVAAVPRVAYLGVLGPRRRLGDVAPHVRAPIGLDLGGDGPEAIALSIVAELQALWHSRSAAHLSETRTLLRALP